MPDSKVRELITRRRIELSLAQVIGGLGVIALTLVLAGVIGAMGIKSPKTKVVAVDRNGNVVPGAVDSSGHVLPGTDTIPPGGGTSGTNTSPGGIAVGPGGGGSGGGGGPRGSGGGPTGPGVANTVPGGRPVPTTAGDRTGVSATSIKWALHAPETFDGTPVNLATDPLEGVSIFIDFINRNGGINGRKIVYQVFDDGYTTSRATTAAKAAVDDYKPFFVSGTLGVDQVAVFAAEAKARGVPYMAGGGSEGLFKDIGMYQVAASYDTHLIQLADFLAAESAKRKGQSPYSGLKRVGVSALNSPYITPAVNNSFKAELERKGLSLVKVVTVEKPTNQTSYGSEIQDLKGANVQILVPAQDPITTSREVSECHTQLCPWKYAFSDFAHDGDTEVKLIGPDWAGTMGLSGACYYESATAYDTTKCGQMKTAHEQWIAVKDENDWTQHGQGGAAGYGLTHIWLKALKDAGPDPTRERFRAALNTYVNYSDLVTGPITYAGSPNLSHGYTKMVVYQAGQLTYKQITPGFVDGF